MFGKCASNLTTFCVGCSWVSASKQLFMLIILSSGHIFWTGLSITYKISKFMELYLCCGFSLENTSE